MSKRKIRQHRKQRRTVRSTMSRVYDLARHRQHPGPKGTRRYSGGK